MDPEISGYENIIIRGLFLGETRKTMLSKLRLTRSPSSPNWASTCRCRCAPTPPACGCGWRSGWSTSIDPEILLLDEAIGAVDGTFLKKAQMRLQKLVARTGHCQLEVVWTFC